MLSEFQILHEYAALLVLILVVMEDALGEPGERPLSLGLRVLILVVMEDALGER